LTLQGSDRLAIVPVGGETSVQLTGDATMPSFDGAYLPRDRSVDRAGFRADWRVSQLNHGLPTVFAADQISSSRWRDAAFGITLAGAGDTYRATERAVKYQLLFLGLTGGLFLLFDLLGSVRVHPVQYLLIGLALCLFYLLLLALSEHVGFPAAYVIAAAAITALIAGYGRTVLGGRRRALGLTGLIAVLYGTLFVLLSLEQYALLVGALGLLVMLAVVMFLTRRLDWYANAG
jgi:inner membrane protein